MSLPSKREEREARSRLRTPKRSPAGKGKRGFRKETGTSESGRRRGSSSTEVSESGTFDSVSDGKKDPTDNELVMIVDDVDDDEESDSDKDVTSSGDVEIDCDDSDSSSTVSEVSFAKRSFYLRLPNNLKFALVFDFDMVTYRKALPKVPAEKSVKSIVDEYVASVGETRRGKKSSYVDDTFKFVVDSFNAIVGNHLLYKQETQQVPTSFLMIATILVGLFFIELMSHLTHVKPTISSRK